MVGERFVLQLHAWDVHKHGHLGDPAAPVGNGAVLWFEVDDLDAAVARATQLRAEVLEDVVVLAGTAA